MAEAKLDFDEATLDKTGDLYNLYDRLYQGMVKANTVDAPSFTDNPPYKTVDGVTQYDEEGVPIIDETEVTSQLSAYSDILMKNSAYLYANAILAVIGSGGSGGGTSTGGFIARSGDSMTGNLSALYGFQSGYGGTKIFETITLSDEKDWAIVTGYFKVTEDATIGGALNLSNSGIYFGGNQVIYYDNSHLYIKNQDVDFEANISIDGSITVGDVVITKGGIKWGDKEFYHSGNCNLPDVDWTMKDANVYGDLTVKGTANLEGRLTALQGFDLGEDGTKMFYSEAKDTIVDGETITDVYLKLNSDLHIINNHGIKFDDYYIVSVRDADKIVSFSAPGMILNLGDSDNGTATSKISLQADIWEYSNNYKIISKEGAGNFVNGLSAKNATGGSTVLQTFYTDVENTGVLFPYQVRFGSTSGPAMYADGSALNTLLTYTYDGFIYKLISKAYYDLTTSPFRNQANSWSATLHFDTDGEFFCFDKPTEAVYFAIKSELYKTRLIEDALFFDDGKFIEGVTDGMRWAGNGYFDGNISSPSFASGFAGYGWAVKTDQTVGGYHATFDSLTVRKKMRVYELEVQKISATNGSLWVSDSCSGDEVRVIYD